MVGCLFEFLKRVALLSVLQAASKESTLIEVVYFMGLVALCAPIGTWLERFEPEIRARQPTAAEADSDQSGDLPVPADNAQRAVRSTFLALLWGAAVLVHVNAGIIVFVESVAAALNMS